MTASPTTYYLGAVAYYVDQNCRHDLGAGHITDERDYVSNLTKGMRDQWRTVGLPSFLHAQTLGQSREIDFGCDAMIVLRLKDRAKICLFEAKWPRLSRPNHPWDKIQKTRSHFSDQIARQVPWSHRAAIWELVIHEQAQRCQPGSFDHRGATCIWHREAHAYDAEYRGGKRPWTHADLFGLVGYSISRPKNLKAMLERAARCGEGDFLPIEGGKVSLHSTDGHAAVEVPAGLAGMERLTDFCVVAGIRHFLVLALEPTERPAVDRLER